MKIPKTIPKKAYLRLDRKNPQITVTFHGAKSKTFALPCDNETATAVLDEINRKIALRVFDITQYVPEPKSKIILSEFYELYMKYRKRESSIGRLSMATCTTDKHALKVFMEKIGDIRIADVDENLINTFIDSMLNLENHHEKTYKPNSVNSYLRHLGGAFSWATRIGLLDHNPFINVKKLPVEIQIRTLTPDEIEKFREYLANKPRWQLEAFNLSLWTGCRLESIVKIKKKDLIWENLRNKKIPFLKLIEKGNKERLIPLLKEPLELIKTRIALLDDPEQQMRILERNTTPSKYPRFMERIKEGYLFWEVTRKDSVVQFFTRAKHAIGITDVSFHNLRKSFATYALEQGVTLESVQHLLGHSDFRTTQAAYSKTTLKKISDELRNTKLI